jgi:cbb3-type cytochrome oxidase maturation protein
MRALLILLPATLLIGGVFAWLFFRAVKGGQFDDLDDPPERVLHDDLMIGRTCARKSTLFASADPHAGAS